MDPELLHTLTRELPVALGETALMVALALVVALLIGVPLGALLYACEVPLLFARRRLGRFTGLAINALRATPFVILLVLLLPLTERLVGSSIGPVAAAVPLAVAAVAFYARLVEGSLRETDQSAIEAASTLGARPLRILATVVVPAALPGLIRGLTVTAISLIGLSAMAGIVGGGGIGDLAIRYGYYRYETPVLVIAVVLLVLIVNGVQWGGDRLARSCER